MATLYYFFVNKWSLFKRHNKIFKNNKKRLETKLQPSVSITYKFFNFRLVQIHINNLGPLPILNNKGNQCPNNALRLLYTSYFISPRKLWKTVINLY